MSRKSISAIISVFIFLLTLIGSGVCEANPQNRFAYAFSRDGSNLTVTINFTQESFDGLDAGFYRPRVLELWPQWQNTCLQLVSIELGQAAVLAEKELTQNTRLTPENAEWSEARAIILSANNTNRVAPGTVLILKFNILQTGPFVLKWRVDRTAIAPEEAQGYLTLDEGTSQLYRISGMVKDSSTNLGIPSATVMVKDTSNTVIAELLTDASGNYTNAVAIPGDYYVVASKTGYYEFSPPSYPVEISDTSPDVTLNVILTPTDATPITLTLEVGWNFISIPKSPSNTALQEVLGDVLSDVAIVWGYNNETKQWLKYKPSYAENTLTAMEHGKGYWIYMGNSRILSVTGTDASPPVHLSQGWNLTGYHGANNKGVNETLTGIADKWSVLWNWDNGQWYVRHPTMLSLPFPSIDSFKQGRAYWIKIKQGQATDWHQ